MTRLGAYEVHPFADDFPLIEGEEFDELVLSIKAHGLREPIVLTHDKNTLVDGRNRYRACEAAGVDATFEILGARYTELLILDFIVDKNIRHRHLNPGQRAMASLAYENRYADAVKAEEADRKSRQAEAKRDGKATEKSMTGADLRQSRAPRAADRAAKTVGSSGRSVQQAKAVQASAPDLADQVRRGELALDRAYKQAKQRDRSMPKPDPVPKSQSHAAEPVMLRLRTHDGQEVPYPQPKSKAAFNETKGDGISWAAWSWNPVTGCLHGCDYCYARAIATDERYQGAYPVGFTPLFHEERLDAPANTTVPSAHRDEQHAPCTDGACLICAYRRVFVCSMADLYGRWVPDEWIKKVHESMLATPWWQYILLTKFPARYVGLDLPPKAWVGTSVDEQKRVRIAEEAFRKIDGVAVKWLSLEPLKEPLEFTDLSMFNWIVIGAQTETRQPTGVVPAFQPPAEWVVRITAQALDAGCNVHWKPNLKTRPGMVWLDQYPDIAGAS